MRLRPSTLVLTALLGCSSLPRSQSGTSGKAYCPGSSPPPCLTAPVCSFDEARQCNECRCGSPYAEQPGVVNAEGIPPVR
jgi:hypothetical protein